MNESNKIIYVLSDLHMGDRGPRDNFGYHGSKKPKQFEQFLEFVEKNNGELIVLGDLFEFWQSSLAKVIITNKNLLDKMADMEVRYILGNHDADLKDFIGKNMLSHPFFNKMSGPIERIIAGKIFKFQHGHEVDPFNSGDSPGWGRMLAIFAGIFEEKLRSPFWTDDETVEEKLEKFGESLLTVWNWTVTTFKMPLKKKSPKPKDELTPAQNPNRISKLIKSYRKNKKKEEYDIAIVGHTHQPGKLKDEDWYFNSGSWVKEHNEFLTISMDGKIEFYRWKDQKAEAYNPTI